MAKLKVEYVAIDKLQPHPKNSNTHSEEQLDKLIGSLEEYGWTKPITTNEHLVILAGHGIYYAAQKSGEKTVPIIRKTGLSESKQRAYVMADNQLGKLSKMDFAVVAEEVNALMELDVNVDVIGFNEEQMTALLKNDLSMFPDTDVEVNRPQLSKDKGVTKKTSKSKLVHTCPHCGENFSA